MTRALLMAGLLGTWVAGVVATQPSLCAPVSGLARLRGIGEASGVAASRQSPGLLWVHNDSGQPSLFAVDASGALRGRVQVTGARVTDWEDIAAGPCQQGSCLYIADIGDNNRSRRQITIYRIPEPRADQKTSEAADVWSAVYPDGPHDAEAVFISSGEIFVVTKEERARTAIYRMRPPADGQSVGRLELVSRLPLERVTGADTSPDGTWVALRTNDELLFYRAQDLAGGADSQPRRVDLTPLREPQGEGVAVGPGAAVYLVGEGGGGGTLATLRCMLR